MTSKRNNTGFTLIETLVAVLLLAFSIAGPLTISSKGLTVALVAKDQTTAFYLAQDAVEFVRYVRDTNMLGGGNWLTGVGAANGINLSNCVSAGGTAKCQFDSLSASAPTVCPSGVCAPLQYNDATNAKQYTYVTTGTVRTIFTRTVSITNPNAGAADEAVLRVVMQWSDIAGSSRSITVTEDLFAWQ